MEVGTRNYGQIDNIVYSTVPTDCEWPCGSGMGTVAAVATLAAIHFSALY